MPLFLGYSVKIVWQIISKLLLFLHQSTFHSLKNEKNTESSPSPDLRDENEFCLIILKMVVVHFSEMLVTTFKSPYCYNQEDHNSRLEDDQLRKIKGKGTC